MLMLTNTNPTLQLRVIHASSAAGGPALLAAEAGHAPLFRLHSGFLTFDDAEANGDSLWAPARYEAARDAMRRFRAAYRRSDAIV